MALISCENAAFAYEGRMVISDLDFRVNQGDYLCVVGENGSGKSTLVKGLLRLKQPQLGSVTMGDGLKQSDIGYLPQQTETQRDFPASVFEVALSGRQGLRGFRPFYSRKDKTAARESLRHMKADHLKKRCYRELSGGQQQRVLLARALCAAKKLLILDEPVAGLDPLAAHEMYKEIEHINRDMGITIIMVSHDVGSVMRFASHVLHLKHTQAFYGTATEYGLSGIGGRFLAN